LGLGIAFPGEKLIGQSAKMLLDSWRKGAKEGEKLVPHPCPKEAWVAVGGVVRMRNGVAGHVGVDGRARRTEEWPQETVSP
jgi:hypothetical protein